MNPIVKIFRKIGGYLFGGRAEADITRAAEMAKEAFPVVEAIAAATPIRSDDEIVALFRAYGVPAVEYYLSAPPGLRGQALAYVAARELARKYPGAPRRVVNLAVELAHIALAGRKPG